MKCKNDGFVATFHHFCFVPQEPPEIIEENINSTAAARFYPFYLLSLLNTQVSEVDRE